MAVDPKTLEIIAKIAIKTLKDEETRNRVLLILMAPLIAVLLLLTVFVYILTNPFEAIAHFFNDNEFTHVKEISNNYSYEQLISTDDENYIESSGFDFSGVLFTNGELEVIYYNQADTRWKGLSYGKTGTIGTSGCGPTSLAMVVSSLTDKIVDPVQMSKWSYENGYYCEGVGSYHSLIPEGARHFGLKVEGCSIKEGQKLIDALAEGKLIIAIMSSGHFTKSGHFIVLRGVTKEGKILVADPISKNRSDKEWDIGIILNEAKSGAGAGGPFWIIGK
ncbi:UNVERIFIED_CONTAM: peptidase C39-like protein [Acetivibrio alkalicellulosi]